MFCWLSLLLYHIRTSTSFILWPFLRSRKHTTILKMLCCHSLSGSIKIWIEDGTYLSPLFVNISFVFVSLKFLLRRNMLCCRFLFSLIKSTINPDGVCLSLSFCLKSFTAISCYFGCSINIPQLLCITLLP